MMLTEEHGGRRGDTVRVIGDPQIQLRDYGSAEGEDE